MKKICIYGLLMVAMASCRPFEKDEKGVTVYPESPETNASKLMRIDVITADIIHVQAFPDKKMKLKESLIVDPSSNFPVVHWDLENSGDSLLLKTDKLLLKISKKTGKIDFYSAGENKKLGEVEDQQSRYFISGKPEGKDNFEIRQVFESPDDEAFYGLGAHQNCQVNYKGEDVNLIQHNIVDVVPFLVSNKNYGILWDNYSITKFGDPRDYKPLSILKLYNEAGEEGGLTARYYSSPDRKVIFTERIEQEIGYKYLDDLHKFPAEFPFNTGVVEWKGYLGSDSAGLYKFSSFSAGYLKIWIDSALIIDNWRQAWNPWNRKFNIGLSAGKKIPVKIEWIPDGGVSYFALECLTPYDTKRQQQLSLYSEAGNSIDYYFINGNNIDEVISGYRKLTGKSPIMPKWAMGLWQSRERYKTQDEILDVVREYRKRQIPLDNIVLDWFYWEEAKWGDHSFDRKRFPDPVGMIKTLHQDLHAKIMISVWPKYYENTRNYEIMKKNGWLYMENVNNRQKDWVGPGYVSTFYDAFNADARKEFWKQLHDSLYVKGIDAWWMDATEPDILSNTSPEARKKLMSPVALGPVEEYFNAYSLMQTKGVYEGQRSADPDKRVFILTRSAFAGQQRYAAATWSGDVASRWSDLQDQIAAGINMGASGIPYWTTDIGGFSLERRYEHATGEDLIEWRELNLRWYQFGVFCPLFRIHGQFPYREIYNLAPMDHPVYKSMVKYDKLRYRLMPYIYTLAGMTYHQDYTIMRPLVMDHPGDVKVLDIADEYMFGPGLLVCPVYAFKARKREVYLPSTSGWYDLLSGKYYEGGKTYEIEAPLEKIPVFAMEGAIIPAGPDMQYTDEKPNNPLTLYIFDGKNGKFTLYEDEGTTYDYETGNFTTLDFTYDYASKKLTIGELKGQYPGMLKERTIIVKRISKEGTGGIDFPALPAKTITYSGQPVELGLQ
jgi:alpha-D-xyloside xylohydrolase